MMSKAKALYLHVPFCQHICAYCDFARSGYHEGLANKWLAQMKKDISTLAKDTLTTIYIGGGTPTALSYNQLDELLEALDPFRANVLEYTIEVNPETLDEEKANILVKHGINRVSLGVQSFDDSLLDIINRRHKLSDIQNSLRLLHSVGIRNISIDLMYSLPSQTLEMWKSDLELASLLPITHISLYSLTIEEHSAFGRMHVKAQDNALEGEMYETAVTFLKNRGFDHYEVSNFSKEGNDSMHNKVYWHYDDFIALGCGASGKEGQVRYSIPFQIDSYIQGDLQREEILVSDSDYLIEYVMMNLRLFEGLDLQKFNDLFHNSFENLFMQSIDKWSKQNYLWFKDNHIGVSESGMPFLNDILVDMMLELENK